MFGLAAQEQILSLAHAILAGEVESCLRLIDELTRHGKDLGRLLADADHEWRLRDAASKRILLEVAVLKAIDARRAVPIDSILQTLQQLRQGLPPSDPPTGTQPSANAAPTAPSPIANAPAPKPAAAMSPPIIQDIPAAASAPPQPAPPAAGPPLVLWTQLLEAVGRASPFTRSYLLEAHPVSWDGKTFTIGFDPEFADHLELVDTPRNRTLLQTKLSELGCGEVQLRLIKADAPPRLERNSTAVLPDAAPAPSTPSTPTGQTARPVRAAPASVRQPDPADFKNDPLIRKALEVFKGQIVEIHNP
jgi:DNA polymerase III subunit gamma/tau